MDSVDVSVVMVTRNQAGLLPMNLSHLELQTHPAGSFEIIVLDRGSDDDTMDVLDRHASGTPVRIRYDQLDGASPAAARNRACEIAVGDWILFLDIDLLAAPNLIKSHVEMQRLQDGACAVVGRIQTHPQVAPETFTKQYRLGEEYVFLPNQPLRFLDWRVFNLSLPRSAILRAGGFDESFTESGLEDVELAWRLENEGLAGVYRHEASAFAWCATTVERERQRMYIEGFTLERLISKTCSDTLMKRYDPIVSWWRAPDRPLVRWYPGLCRVLAANTGLFRFLCTRMLAHALWRGYVDGLKGRPPRHAET